LRPGCVLRPRPSVTRRDGPTAHFQASRASQGSAMAWRGMAQRVGRRQRPAAGISHFLAALIRQTLKKQQPLLDEETSTRGSFRRSGVLFVPAEGLDDFIPESTRPVHPRGPADRPDSSPDHVCGCRNRNAVPLLWPSPRIIRLATKILAFALKPSRFETIPRSPSGVCDRTSEVVLRTWVSGTCAGSTAP
jgi:hypothetical protein